MDTNSWAESAYPQYHHLIKLVSGLPESRGFGRQLAIVTYRQLNIKGSKQGKKKKKSGRVRKQNATKQNSVFSLKWDWNRILKIHEEGESCKTVNKINSGKI